jgi:hypothetical protein
LWRHRASNRFDVTIPMMAMTREIEGGETERPSSADQS